jgi:hypothetical protein
MGGRCPKRSNGPSSFHDEEETEHDATGRRNTGTVNTELIYSSPGYIEQQRSQQAAAILKRALSPDAIIFDIPTSSLDHVTVVDLISQQLGALAGYTNINNYSNNMRNVHLEIVFVEEESSRLAVEKGVTIDGIISKGMPWIDAGKRRTIKVNLSHIPLNLYKTLAEDLRHALIPYGAVKQIRKYTDCNGHWFGEASVIIDRMEDDIEYAGLPELSRMIYIESMDTYIPATYQGAPKICFHCRLAVHERKDCPDLKNVQCHRCQGYGHISKHCKKQQIRQQNLVPATKVSDLITEAQMNTQEVTEDGSQHQETETSKFENVETSSMELEESEQVQEENDESDKENTDNQQDGADQDSNTGALIQSIQKDQKNAVDD